ncbi:hypothetical protein TIFTF001_012491 [Ficus carica]|uniref:Cytochrome b561 domain-containing protein n=1 Tax=Ficus carica TaxID=3494 RepID=A0AA88ACE1_FICCA|nr:hypothetical protein TIFTF001_012491 [Ficus carica]
MNINELPKSAGLKILDYYRYPEEYAIDWNRSAVQLLSTPKSYSHFQSFFESSDDIPYYNSRTSSMDLNGVSNACWDTCHQNMLSVLLATAGAVMSIKHFENSFNNNHQRIGLVLYSAIWIQGMIGFFRPQRGKKGRKVWYVVHWILGTMTSVVGVINIYTGLEAYHKKTSRSTRLWTILFTAEVSLIAFFYLFQDKNDYILKQGVILEAAAISPHDHHQQSGVIINIPDQIRHNINVITQKELLPQPCGKRNALRNLFD